MQEILILILLSVAPLIELRGSIPYGILVADLNPFFVLVIAITANLLMGIFLYYFIKHVIPLLRNWQFFDKIYSKYVEKTQKKIHNKVERYGDAALAIFIAIPLPGSGVASASVAAIFLGISFRNFFKASFIGLLIAGIIIMLLTLSGSSIIGALK